MQDVVTKCVHWGNLLNLWLILNNIALNLNYLRFSYATIYVNKKAKLIRFLAKILTLLCSK